ncbi:MAG: response regulator transcription factor [Rhodospirillales bacterium]|nr:response regulator transcription factor [Rhodospirillales bacterium]
MNEAGAGKTVRAIIIDDDELMRRVVVAALMALNCEIVGEAGDGEEGIQLYRDTNPDLVLLDIRMPNMNGIEVLEAFEDEEPAPYVVMMTFLEDEESVQDAMIGGAKDYLRKNMTMQEMVARLERHVTRLSGAA